MLFILILLLAAVAFVVSIVMALRNAAMREWRFELSSVIGGAMTAIGRAPLLFVGSAMLCAAVPIASLFMTASGETLSGVAGVWTAGLFTTVLVSALYLFGLLTMVGAGIEALRGEVRAGRVLRRALVILPSATAVSILYWMGVGIGFMLFVVPGAMLAVTCLLVLPVLFAEGAGVPNAFSRSAVLTKGVRWHLFLLTVIGFIFALFVQGLFGGVSLLLGGGIMSMIVYLLATALLGMLPPALVASAYHALVTAKEGVGTSELERVFA